MRTLKNFFIFFLVIATTAIYNIVEAQNNKILEPVKWNFSLKQLSKSEAELIFTANIENKWHLYSQDIPAGLPIATTFKIEKSKHFKLVGKVSEPKPIEEYDPNFEMVLKFFANKAVFKQKIEVLSNEKFDVKGAVEFSCCDDTKCLPPTEVEFSIAVDGGKYDVLSKIDTLKTDSIKKTDSIVAKTDTTLKKTISSIAQPNKEKSNLWWIFIAGFIGGFIALLTPCVFPMIPMTVSFFIKKSKSRKKGIRDALIYGLSIVVIYVLLGLGVTLIFGADALNQLATNAWFNVFFFVLLVVFAAAFFGAFELQLPSSWTNAMDARADKSGGLIGIFFMAFTLALVSFSCTGPIIGTLLVEAVSVGSLSPLIGMTGFAIALAIPFTIFAIFPSWLQSLPKSGGWLNSVKVVLGFLELALALKFLSTADLVSHWGILPRETFLVLWIVIFAMLGFYLLGKLKFAHDSDLPYISVPRLLLAIVSFSFALYMVPGLWGAPLKAISAFSPPMSTQDFDLSASHYVANTDTTKISAKKNADIFHCPLGINCFFDYQEGIEYAKKVNKPLFLDFTGWGCVNCRNMEVSVWSDPEVLKRLKNDWVVVSLYVDDKIALPENEQYISNYGGKNKKIITIGNKWSDFQASKFGTNSQPFYVLLDHEGNMLTEPHAYDLNVNNYIKFLDKGLENFKKISASKH